MSGSLPLCATKSICGEIMIRSMTAFASAESASALGVLSFELRSVNHRYLELNLRLPEEMRSIEATLRERVNARLTRGKVDVNLRFRSESTQGSAVELNPAMLQKLEQVIATMQGRFPELHTDALALLSWPGVLLKQEIDQASLQQAVLDLFEAALDDMVSTRSREGERLAVFLRERLETVESIVADVRGWLPEIRTAMRARLDTKLAELKQPLEPGRIEQEIVLQLQRLDVDEELDRLSAHVAEARRILKLPDAVGRRLDFLMQEFNREANTLGSKSIDQRTTQAAIDLKVLIEQIREQVQNIE